MFAFVNRIIANPRDACCLASSVEYSLDLCNCTPTATWYVMYIYSARTFGYNAKRKAKRGVQYNSIYNFSVLLYFYFYILFISELFSDAVFFKFFKIARWKNLEFSSKDFMTTQIDFMGWKLEHFRFVCVWCLIKHL